MSKFFVPKRYDADLGNDGVWFDISDSDGTFYGRFKCKVIDEFSQRYERDAKRIRMKYKEQLQKKKLEGEEAIRVVFVETSLCDWELPTDPTDKKAKPVPYDAADALEYFQLEDTKWILAELVQLASKKENFKQPVDDAEEIAGE